MGPTWREVYREMGASQAGIMGTFIGPALVLIGLATYFFGPSEYAPSEFQGGMAFVSGLVMIVWQATAASERIKKRAVEERGRSP